MGCLKKLIQSIILCLALIGFFSIGGNDFIKTKWTDYQVKHSKQIEKNATKIGDFSKIGDEFEISKAVSLFGYNGVIAEHKASGQKMVILDTKGNELITAEDIQNDKVDKKIESLTKKFKYSAIKIKELNMGKKGSMTAYGKTVPYVKFNAKITKLPFGDIDGIISTYNENRENKILIGLNEKNKYSQIVSEEFFKNIIK